MQGRQAPGAMLLASFVVQLLALPLHLAAHHHEAGHHGESGQQRQGDQHVHVVAEAGAEASPHAHSHGQTHGHEPHSALDHAVPALSPSAPATWVAGLTTVALAPGAPTLHRSTNHVDLPSVGAEVHRSTGPPHPVGARAPPAC